MSKRSGFRPVLFSIQILLAVAVALALTLGGYWYFGPFRGFETETFVEIHHGMSSRQIARQLTHQGVVRSQWAFLAVRYLHPHAALQAGEYRFGAAQTPWQVFEKSGAARSSMKTSPCRKAATCSISLRCSTQPTW